MKRRRIVAVLLVLTMVCGLFAGCGKKDTTKTKKKGSGVLTVGIPQVLTVSDFDDNALTKYFEEKIGAEIEFVFFNDSKAGMEQQLSLMCASEEELPDVLWGFQTIDKETMDVYGEDEYLIDLTDLIEEYGVNYKKTLESLPKETRERVERLSKDINNGAIYGMPMISDYAIDDLEVLSYINKKWLDKVGMSIPTTTDELYAVLKAFKEQDVNENGETDDEIPIMGTQTGIASPGTATDYIMNAFVPYDSGVTFNVDDGKVWSPVGTDEWRQGLTYLNKLVSEGLMADQSFTITGHNDYISAIFGSDDVPRVGIFVAHPAAFVSTGTERLSEYVALPPLQDATGKGGYTMTKDPTIQFSTYITENCEDTELAMKFIDAMYTGEAAAIMRNGEEGVDWKRSEGKNYLGTDCEIEVINENAYFEGNSTWGKLGGIYANNKYTTSIIKDDQAPGIGKDTNKLYQESWEVYQSATKIRKESARDLVYTTEERDIRSEMMSAYTSHVKQFLAQTAVGEKPLNDSTWNEYLAGLKTYGEDELIKTVQSAYKRK